MSTTAQQGFQLDLNRCTGCGACAVACAVENELSWGTSWRFIETFNPDRIPGLPLHHLSLACNHCAEAPCMEHCPALAYAKDPETGAVLLDPDHCIGCKYCTWACPYDAPRYEPDLGMVAKCTFCNDRQRDGHSPACVSQCPTGALRSGDLSSLTGSPTVAGFPATAANPSIRFLPLRTETAPEPTPEDEVSEFIPRSGAAKTSLASEWPLVVFTLVCTALAGVMAAPAGRAILSLPVLLAALAVAASASTLHLGRKLRAWRAILNVRRSWLSREVLFFAAFAGVSFFHLTGIAAPTVAGWTAAALGFCLLFAIDRVYDVTRTPGLALHSAGTLLTGITVASLVADLTPLWVAAVGFKCVAYARRKVLAPTVPARRVGWELCRLLVGLILPTALFLLAPGQAAVAWILFGIGEIVDRCEFYIDLTVQSPARQMREDLRRMLARVPGSHR